MKVCKTLIALLLLLEAISALSLFCLDLHHTPYPWSLLTLLQYGYYGVVILTFFIICFPILSVIIYLKGGFSRYLSYFFISFFILLICSFILGVALFNWFMENTFSAWPYPLLFLQQLYQEPLNWRYFCYSELSALVPVFLMPIYILFENYRPAHKVLGNAHFANGFEMQKAGIFHKEKESILIGKKFGAPIYSNGFEHVLVFAPSGSGKTRSIAIPNLLNYPYSIVCNDVKLTLFETTSGYRQDVLGHQCYCFAPAKADGKSHRFNPLSSISNDKNQRITDIQRIAHILIPDNPKTDPIWAQASRKLFKALLLFLLDSPEHPKTLGELNRLIKQQFFDGWLQDLLDNTDHFDPEFYRNGYSYINNHEKTRSSILETFSGYFELFDDPIIDAATSGSDFDLNDLRRKKMTIYVGFTDEDMERLAPLLTLFWQQLISAMIRDIPKQETEPYPLLCLIDEFSSLGRIERLRRSLKLLREYRVRCILMFQYIAQTYEKYSHDEARAFTNIKTKIAFATEDINDAEFISKMLGTRTKRVVTRGVTNQQQGYSNSTNIAYQAIPLMRPDELMKMPADVNLIIRSGYSPIKAKQYIWYKEKRMKSLPQKMITLPIQTIQRRSFIRSKPDLMKASNFADLF
jgi:type IV secretion system protein VirD4